MAAARHSPRTSGMARMALAVGALVTLAGLTALLRPDLGLVVGAPLIVQAHLYFALAAMSLGLIVLAGRKGDLAHRIGGWIWVTMIGTAIVSSFWIMEENPGRFSWIHISSLVHGATLTLGVAFAKLHNIRWHARMMAFTYISGLLGAAALALIPGRLMWSVLFE